VSCEKTALLPVTPEEAFALVTEPERLRRWSAVAARIDLRAGGTFRWTVSPGHTAAGTVKEVEPGKRLVLGFGWEGDGSPAPDGSTVTITIEPQGDSTLVRLVHEGLTPEQSASHDEGWTHFFGRLELAAAKGDAGPDEWSYAPERLDPITAGEAVLAVSQDVLRGLTDADRDKPTPCPAFTVHQLVEHLAGSMVQIGALAGAEVQLRDGVSAEERVAFAAQQVTEAWSRRGLEGAVQLGDAEVPTTFAAALLPVELLLHTWDLAQATHQVLHVSDEVVAYCSELAYAGLGEQARANGSFGPALEPAADADALGRLVAFSGRRAA
jgi:uncharacterized protein (TIGR03086 family)